MPCPSSASNRRIPSRSKVQVHQNHLHQKKIFIKNHFHQKPLSSKTTFIKNHFHQKPLSSKTTFIKMPLSSKCHFHQNATFIKMPLSSKCHFHQKPFSSKTNFIKNQFHQKPISSKTNFIKNQFHQKPISSEDFLSEGPTTRVCVKAPRSLTQTRLMPTFGVSAGLFVEHCRPKAGNVQQKSPLRVQRWVFRV